MATPAPPTPGSPPTLPTANDAESTFDTLWDAFNTWLTTVFWPYLVSVVASTFANATEAQSAAATATAQANAAIAAASAAGWVSGTDYPAYAAVYSPITLLSYRTDTAGVSSIDPSIDDARWVRLGSPGVPDFLLHAQGII